MRQHPASPLALVVCTALLVNTALLMMALQEPPYKVVAGVVWVAVCQLVPVVVLFLFFPNDPSVSIVRSASADNSNLTPPSNEPLQRGPNRSADLAWMRDVAVAADAMEKSNPIVAEQLNLLNRAAYQGQRRNPGPDGPGTYGATDGPVT